MSLSLNDWRSRGREYRHRGHPIFYVDEAHGAGPVLVCIHGFPSASWDWSELWPALTRRFARVIAIDMIGFGFSAKPRTYDYDLVDQADLHENLLRSLGVDHVHVLAHDYGVSVAQEWLARHAEGRGVRVHSVALLNGGLFPETHRALPVQRLLVGPLGPLIARLGSRARFESTLRAVFGPDTPPTPMQLEAFWALWTHDGGDRIAHKLIRYILDRRRHRDRWVGALQTTQVPLRLINGSADPISGAHLVERYRELVPNPDVVALDRVGHYPQVEAPGRVLDAYLPFVERVLTVR
jgi:pimeloyl-ACP methyl ester carboxylesterase